MPEYIVGPCHIMSACSTILLDLARHNAADMWVSEMKEYLEDLTQDRDQWPRHRDAVVSVMSQVSTYGRCEIHG